MSIGNVCVVQNKALQELEKKFDVDHPNNPRHNSSLKNSDAFKSDNSSSVVTKDQIMSHLYDFITKKHIPASMWENFQDEAINYIEQSIQGKDIDVIPATGIEYFGALIDQVVNEFKSIVRESSNFKEDHTYYIKDENGKEHKVDISVSSLARQEEDFIIDSYTKEKVKTNAGMLIGNTVDTMVRDFFAVDNEGNPVLKRGVLPKEYKNLDIDRYNALYDQLEVLKKSWDLKFKNEGGYKVISTPFAMGGFATDAKGKRFSIAGETDLVLITGKGNLYIYDCKTNSTGRSLKDNIHYKNQLNLYRKIFIPSIAKILGIDKKDINKNVNISMGLLEFTTKYPKSEYTKTLDNGQVTYNNKNVETLGADQYSINLNIYEDKNGSIVNNSFVNVERKAIKLELESLSQEEKDLIGEEMLNDIINKYFTEETSDEIIDETISKSLETDELVLLDSSQFTDALTPSEINKYGTSLAKLIAFYVDKLKTNPALSSKLFPEEFKNKVDSNDNPISLVGMETKDILTHTRLSKLIRHIRDQYFTPAFEDIDIDSPNYAKQEWIVNNFDTIVQAANGAFLRYLGYSVNLSKEYSESTDDSTVTAGNQDGREAWAINAMETDFEASMHEDLKTTLALFPKAKYRFDEESESYVVVDYSTDTVVPVIEFEDFKQVSQKALSLLYREKTRDGMINRMREELEYLREEDEDTNPENSWLISLYQEAIDNPRFSSMLFSDFRRNRLDYSVSSAKFTKKGLEVTTFDLINSQMRRVIKDRLLSNINAGNAEIFQRKGNTRRFIVDKSIVADVESQFRQLNKRGINRKKKNRILGEILENFGYDNYSSYLSQLNKNDFESLVRNVNSLIKKAVKLSSNTSIIPAVALSHDTKGYSLYDPITNILSKIIPAEYSVSAYSQGKNYQAYVLPSFIGDLMEDLSNTDMSEEDYNQMLQERFGKTFQTMIETKDGITYIANWLDELAKNPSSRSQFKRIIQTAFNEEQYKDMDITNYPLSTFIEYYSQIYNNKDDGTRRFYVPIMSDKPASEYIQFKGVSFSESIESGEVDSEVLREAKQAIANKLKNFVAFEIGRIKDVTRNSIDKKGFNIEIYNSKIPDTVKAKLKNKETLKCEDFLDKDGNLASWAKKGGASFHFLTMFNKEIEEKTEFGKMLMEYISKDYKGKYLPSNLSSMIEDIIMNRMEDEYNDFENFTIDNAIMFLNYVPSIYSGNIDIALQEYYWNTRLAQCNILNMTLIDPAFYKNAVDVQKRNAQIHSMIQRVDTSTEFNDRGIQRKLSEDGMHRYLILPDIEIASNAKEYVNRGFNLAISKARKEGKIGEARALEALRDRSLPLYDSITSTDGQAMSTIEGMLKKLGMLGEDITKIQEAMYKIKEGKFDFQNLSIVLQPFKPFSYGFEYVSNSHQTTKVGVQLKDSECLLCVSSLIAEGLRKEGVLSDNNILEILTEEISKTAWDEKGNWNGTGIDTIVFESVVKTGIHKVMPDLTKASDPRKVLSTILKSDLDLDKNGKETKYIHKHPFYEWGKQQEVPAHAQDNEQAMPSQGRALSTAYIRNDDIIELPDGSKITGKNLKEEHDKQIATDLNEGLKEFRKEFKLDTKYNVSNKTVRELSRFMMNVLKRDSKTTFEDIKAVCLENGEFSIPLGDPTSTERFASSLFSEIKRLVNKEKMPGGFYVQSADFGFDIELEFKEDGTLKYMPILISFPTSKLEQAMTREDGSIMTIAEAKDAGILTDDDLLAIIERIPTESKISVFASKIVGFLPKWQGERIIAPKEGVLIAGWDMDIDKLDVSLKYTNNSMQVSPEGLSNTQLRKNRIFDLQYGALTSESAFTEQFAPQNFQRLKDIANKLQDKSFIESLDMTKPESQFYFQNGNMVGKRMVAISASTNVAHALINISNIKMRVPNISINGVRIQSFGKDGYVQLDPTLSPYDNTKISDITGNLVGASADNAKESIVSAIGYTPETANLFTALIRVGIPVETVSYMLNQPIVKSIAQQAIIENRSLTSAIEKEATKLAGKDYANYINSCLNEDITDDKLLKNINNNGKDAELNNKIIGILASFVPVADDIFKVSQIVKLNSTQNAVGPTVFDTLKTLFSIREFFNTDMNTQSLFNPTDIENMLSNLPFLEPLIACYDKAVPALMENEFIALTKSFMTLCDVLGEYGMPITSMSETELRKVFNEFIVYYNTGLQHNGKPIIDGSYDNRKRVFYDIPLSILQLQNKGINEFIDTLSFRRTASKRVGIPALVMNTSMLNPEVKEHLVSELSSLVNEGREDYQYSKQVAEDLLDYNIFRGGFGFTPTGFMNMMSNTIKKQYKDGAYLKAVNASNFEVLGKDNYLNFIRQRLMNNPYGKAVFDLDSLIQNDKKNSKDTFEERVKHYTENAIEFIEDNIPANTLMIKYDKNYYIVDSKNSLLFRKVNRLGFGKQGFEYDMATDAADMKSVNNTKAIEEMRNKYQDIIDSYTLDESEVESVEEDEDGIDEQSSNTAENAEAEQIVKDSKASIIDGVSIADFNEYALSEEGGEVLEDIASEEDFDNSIDIDNIKFNSKEKISTQKERMITTIDQVLDYVKSKKQDLTQKERIKVLNNLKELAEKIC